MKESKKIFLIGFTLCLVLQVGSCSLFQSEDTAANTSGASQTSELGDTDSDNAATLERAKARLQTAKDNLASRETLLRGDKAKIVSEKVAYDDMVAASKKSGKDFTDPKTDTYRQGEKVKKLQEDYDNRLRDLKAEVAKTETELQNVSQSAPSKTPVKIQVTQPKSDDDIGWLLPILVGLVGLMIIGGIGFSIYRISKKIDDERAQRQDGFRTIGSNQRGLRDDVDQLKTTAELLSKQLSDQRAEFARLKSQGQGGTAFTAERPPPPPAQPAPEFPISVESFLARKGSGAPFGKHDPLVGVLKENDGDGAFYLVRSGSLAEDERYAVPRTKQFVTRDDFTYHYSNYYECGNPAGGEVWIRKPSTVRRVADGWKLGVTGELEIR